MSGPLARVVAAELVKLRSLPAVVGVVLGTPVVAAALAAAYAAAAAARTSAGDLALATVPYLQVATVLVGVLAAGTEHAGRQIATTLTVTPARWRHLAAQSLAVAATSALTACAGLAAALTAAAAWGPGDGVPGARSGVRPLLGALVALVLVGLLAHALTVLTRSLVGALGATLTLLLVVSPLLATVTEHARWLPDRAGSLLYLPGRDPVLGPVGGGLVLVAWVATAVLAAGCASARRDV
ncbi:ABC transporter permease [Cellulomonas iranensis]|uniref:ABC transporter permease n=1 Tax=Cellulomonas iranensis TaxID=76862 RepID=UPI0013D47D9C|nr:ABC transporter permease [Cellulomonas iranensis]